MNTKECQENIRRIEQRLKRIEEENRDRKKRTAKLLTKIDRLLKYIR